MEGNGKRKGNEDELSKDQKGEMYSVSNNI